MRTIQEIAASLPNLTTAELHHIERVIHDLYRVRHEPIIYDDDYGIWTEYDQASVASEVLDMFDNDNSALQVHSQVRNIESSTNEAD